MKSLKLKLWQFVLNYLTKPVNLDQVISVSEAGQVKIDGRIIEPNELKNLQEEVKAFQNFRLKTILLNTIKANAEVRMFRDSKDFDDMLAGKLTLYVVDIQETVMMKILSAPQQNQMTIPSPYKPR